jgi:hypothetical protein
MRLTLVLRNNNSDVETDTGVDTDDETDTGVEKQQQ